MSREITVSSSQVMVASGGCRRHAKGCHCWGFKHAFSVIEGHSGLNVGDSQEPCQLSICHRCNIKSNAEKPGKMDQY